MAYAFDQQSLGCQLNPDFVPIHDPLIGDYKIEKNLVTVSQYTDFLNATAVGQDPHHLYNEKMKMLIARNPKNWMREEYFSVCYHQSNNPIAYVSLSNAMRYCNWFQNGKPLSKQSPMTTERGAYDFSDENGHEVVMLDPNATCFLPTVDQLATASSQLIFPENADFFEWTASTNNSDSSMSNLVFHTSSKEVPVTHSCDILTINPSLGFRLGMSEEALTTTDLQSSNSSLTNVNNASLSQIETNRAVASACDKEEQAIFADSLSMTLFSFFWTSTGCNQVMIDVLALLIV